MFLSLGEIPGLWSFWWKKLFFREGRGCCFAVCLGGIHVHGWLWCLQPTQRSVVCSSGDRVWLISVDLLQWVIWLIFLGHVGIDHCGEVSCWWFRIQVIASGCKWGKWNIYSTSARLPTFLNHGPAWLQGYAETVMTYLGRSNECCVGWCEWWARLVVILGILDYPPEV